MALIISTDEAGYGPNLGPLVVSVSVWTSEIPLAELDLDAELSPLISQNPKHEADRIFISDSKAVYSYGDSMARLERAVLPLLSAIATPPRTWKSLYENLDPVALKGMMKLPWYEDYDEDIPIDLANDELEKLSQNSRDFFANSNLKFVRLQSRVIEPEEFNSKCDELGNKATLLTTTSLELVKNAIDQFDSDEVLIRCDKHGGRSHYAASIQQFITNEWVKVIRESQDESVYRFNENEKRFEMRFTAKGESYIPVAVASIVCKYLRELSMRAFNQFWTQRVKGLESTAGYPVDARRFRNQVQAEMKKLGLHQDQYWRSR